MRFITAFLLLVFAWHTQAAANPEIWRIQGWKTDFSKMSVDPSSILNGGPPKDGIPPIDEPKFVPVSEADSLTDREPVIGLAIDGDARAYPLRIMTWHEIVNDVVGGQPVAVTYCPLCNAAIVFDARHDGQALSFGTTGKLRNSDLIMYDRKTESWWQQFTGEAIAGDMLGSRLKLVPARLESWKDFRTRHPNGKVLVPNNPNFRDYGRNPYANYDSADRPFLFAGPFPEGIPAMARVIVVRRLEEPPLIVSLAKARQSSPLLVDGISIGWKGGQASALDTGDITQGREVGSVIVKDAATRADLPYDVTFAFVAHAFHPDAEILR